MWQHSHPPLEIYGTTGTLALADPNFFGGEPRFSVCTGPRESVRVDGWPLSTRNFDLPSGGWRAGHALAGRARTDPGLREG